MDLDTKHEKDLWLYTILSYGETITIAEDKQKINWKNSYFFITALEA